MDTQKLLNVPLQYTGRGDLQQQLDVALPASAGAPLEGKGPWGFPRAQVALRGRKIAQVHLSRRSFQAALAGPIFERACEPEAATARRITFRRGGRDKK
jgi:hypothetical protein